MKIKRSSNTQSKKLLPGLAIRSSAGGILMGLANLVPGISGGTMLLATGIYPHFIAAIAELSTLRFRLRSIVVIGTLGIFALLAVAMLAGTIKDTVVEHRWIAYSLFIGLTLGGVPVIKAMIGEMTRSVFMSAASGILLMSALVLVQQAGASSGNSPDSGVLWLFIAGLGGAAAMVLPGISGGYILLVTGQYITILAAIEDLRSAIVSLDMGSALSTMTGVLMPFGVGLIAGIVVVSNLIRLLLDKFRVTTLGVLLGLLVGAVVGLWPFRRPVEPIPGQAWAGKTLTEADIAGMNIDSWPTELFAPSAVQVLLSLALVLLGYAVTWGVAWIGNKFEGARTPG